jgi:hypothetical protein
MRREVTIGGGHASGELGWRHFGVGDLEDTQVRVIWPDGEAGDWQPVKANGFYIVERNKPVQAWAGR